jgi:hypothetical protein
MFSLTQNFKISDIENDIKSFIDSMQADIVNALKGTLIELVDRARAKTKSEGGFGNITWNLRSSIGGVIVADHAIIETYFPPIGKGEVGRSKGIAYAQELALLSDSGEITIVIVAGEDYAYLVESRDDTDVISGSSLRFEKTFLSLMNK